MEVIETLAGLQIDLSAIGGSKISLWTLISAVLLLGVALISIRIILNVAGKTLKKVGLDERLQSFIMGGIKVLLYFIAVIILLDQMNIPISSLLAAFTAASAAIALALKDSLAQVASGILLIINRPYEIGDYIVTGSIEGRVVAMKLMHTTILTNDNRLIHCPNSQVFGGEIANNTGMATRRVDLTFTISYDDPIDKVKEALLEAARGVPEVLADPAPFANVINYGESNIEYTLRVWVLNEDYWPAYFRLQEDVMHSLTRHGLSMSYNHLNVHIINDEQ